MIIIKQFENKNILLVDTDSLKASLGIKNLGYFATHTLLPSTGSNGDYAIVGSTDTIWVWDSDTSAWKNTGTASTGDMMKTIYDTNDDGKVDAADIADSVDWTGVQNKPSTFNPSAHSHNDLYYTDVQMDILLSNKQPLSTVLTNTTASYTTSIDARLANTSGTNTGDNATNSQYSGLATSKQDTLVSGTNIKTVNGNSLLGSGDIVISGGSGGSQIYEGNIDGQTFVGMIARFTVRAGQTIAGVKISGSSLPTGSNFTLDVRKNGTATTNSIFTSDVGVSITTAQSATNGIYTTTKTAIDNGTLVENDVLYIYITSAGSTLSLQDLYFLIY